MKKTLAIFLLALTGFGAYAQETPAKFKLYGFIRNYAVVDSREVSAGTHDLYYYMPKDQSLNAAGEDMNAGFNWKFISLTTRLGLDISGYEFGGFKMAGKVEADFYSLNGSGSANTIAQLRLRQAYMSLTRAFSDGEKFTLNIGQTWHPMAVDLPFGINLETCAPFGPFNRSPQVMGHSTMGKLTLTYGFLYLSQYLPMDAQANAKSVAPWKYGFPEQYLGITYKDGPFVAKLGVDNVLSKPFRIVKDDAGVDHKAGGLLEALTGFAYAQYGKGMFQIKAKAALAMSGEHMNILSGYGIADYDAATYTYTYTPMRDFTSFVSAQYGKRFQVMGMIGYMKQLGTAKDLMGGAAAVNTAGGNLWLNTAAATNIQQAVRLTPTVVWNIGKLQMGIEYDFTYAEFGNSGATRNARGIYEASNTHWLGNHRLIWLSKFNF